MRRPDEDGLGGGVMGGPWRTCDHVEIATLEYVEWYNHRRPHSGAADLPPAAFEALYDSVEHRLAQPETQPI